jgi:hypothetical protein
MSKKDDEITKSVHPNIEEEISLEEHLDTLITKREVLLEKYNGILGDINKSQEGARALLDLILKVQGTIEFISGYTGKDVAPIKEPKVEMEK